MFVLVAYDIADERRLKQVAKLMEAYGERVQKSVFECVIDQRQLEILTHKLRYLMKRKEDKVQFYPLCDACERRINSTSQASFASEDVYVC
jgi:CRISPR-associated protein Cas2